MKRLVVAEIISHDNCQSRQCPVVRLPLQPNYLLFLPRCPSNLLPCQVSLASYLLPLNSSVNLIYEQLLCYGGQYPQTVNEHVRVAFIWPSAKLQKKNVS